MSTQLQLRKGNTAQTQIFTGALAEVTVDTDQDTLVVHDGTTVGGHYVISKQQFTQNVANINSFTQSAFNKANTGGTFTGNVIVSQNLTVSGNLVVQGNTIINETTINATSISTNDLLFISNTTNAIAPNTGALLVDGGTSIDKNLFVGGKVIINQAYDYGTGNVQISGNTFITGDLVSEEIHAQGGTNLYLETIDLANTVAWNYTNATPIGYAAIAPDFSNNATKISENSANNWHGIEMSTDETIFNYRYYTHSIYAKAAERNYMWVKAYPDINAHVTFDLANGTYTQESANSIIWTNISDSGNGWYRCSLAFKTGSANSLFISTGPTIQPGLTDDIYQGVSGYGIYAWHPQLEYGRRPSEFTVTSNVVVNTINDIVAESGSIIAREGDIHSLNVGDQTIAGTLSITGPMNTDGISANGVVHILNTTESSSNSLGALVVDGGIGVRGNIFFGDSGSLVHTNAATELRTTDNQPVILRALNNPFTFNTNATLQLPSGGDVTDFSGTSVTTLQGVTNRGGTTTNQIFLTGTRASSNVETGDLVVDGGIGIAGNVYADAVYTDNFYTLNKVPLIQPVNQFAQSAYNTANGANGLAGGAYGHANNAFNSSNATNQFAQSAYNTANGANGLAAGAFGYANTEVSRINAVDSGQNTTITQVNQFAQAAYNQANSSVQNTTFLSSANSVITTNQSGYLVASDAKFIDANNTLISSNVNVGGTLGVAGIISKISGGVLANQPSGTPVALDSFSTSEFRTVIYCYTVTAAIGYQYHELVIVHDDITANVLITVETVPTGKIADYTVELVNGVVTVYANTQSSATFTYTREGFLNTGSNILPTDLQLATASAVDLGVGIVDNPLIDLNAL